MNQTTEMMLYNATGVDVESHGYNTLARKAFMVGHWASLLLLLATLIIYLFFKLRNRTLKVLHMNTVIAFMLNAIASLNLERLAKNQVWCQLNVVIVDYCTLCTHTWVLCEVFYFHLGLAMVNYAHGVLARRFMTVGWVLPAAISGTIYAARHLFPGDNNVCSTGEYFVFFPISILQIISLIYLARVGITMRDMNRHNDADAYSARNGIRTTGFMIPLFAQLLLMVPVPITALQKTGLVWPTVAFATSVKGITIAFALCMYHQDFWAAVRDWLARPDSASTTTGMTRNNDTEAAPIYSVTTNF